MLMKRVSLLLVALSLCAVPMRAASLMNVRDRQAVTSPADQTPSSVAPPSRSDPFKKLFVSKPSPRVETWFGNPRVLAPERQARTKPKVVCGMVIVPGDPKVDPRIHFDAPKREARSTIRAIQPPVCWPD